MYEAEVADHSTTQNTLEEANRKISDLQDELAKVVQEQEAKLALAQKEVLVLCAYCDYSQTCVYDYLLIKTTSPVKQRPVFICPTY